MTAVLADGMKSESPLETAALWGQAGAVKMLLSKGATANKAQALAAATEAIHAGCGGGTKEDYEAIVQMVK
jgi:hypothetical protein